MLGKRSAGSTRRLTITVDWHFSCNIWKAFNRRLLYLQKTPSYFTHHSGKSRTDFVLKDGHLEMPAQQTCESYVTSNGKQGVPYGAKPPRRRLIFFVLPLQNHPKHVCLVRGRATRLVIHRVSRQTTHHLNGEPWECGCEEAPQHILTTARTARMPVGVFVYPMMLLHEHATIMFMRLEVLQIQGVPH